MTTSQLIRAPKARVVLAELAGIRALPADRPGPLPPYRELVESTHHLLAIVGESISGSDYWGEETRREALTGVPEHVLESVAAEVAASRGAAWWCSDLDTGRQTVLASDGVVPDLGAARSLAVRAPAPGLAYGAMITTSTWLDEAMPAAQLIDVEHLSYLTEPVRAWRATVDREVWVHEIHGPDDYLALCRRYPRTGPIPNSWYEHGVGTGRGLAPDWSQIRDELDGVHLSVAGLLTATGVPLRDGSFTALWLGPDAEFTVWFRSVLSLGERHPGEFGL